MLSYAISTSHHSEPPLNNYEMMMMIPNGITQLTNRAGPWRQKRLLINAIQWAKAEPKKSALLVPEEQSNKTKKDGIITIISRRRRRRYPPNLAIVDAVRSVAQNCNSSISVTNGLVSRPSNGGRLRSLAGLSEWHFLAG